MATKCGGAGVEAEAVPMHTLVRDYGLTSVEAGDPPPLAF